MLGAFTTSNLVVVVQTLSRTFFFGLSKRWGAQTDLLCGREVLEDSPRLRSCGLVYIEMHCLGVRVYQSRSLLCPL